MIIALYKSTFTIPYHTIPHSPHGYKILAAPLTWWCNDATALAGYATRMMMMRYWILLRGVILLGIESAPLSEDDEDDVDDDVSSTEYTGRMSTSHG